MKKGIKSTIIPTNSTIANGFDDIDYYDIYLIKKQTDKSAEEISKDLMELPQWVIALFKLRNAIVGIFGLKTDKNSSEQESFFKLIENREDEIIMGEDDTHLNFRGSILKDKSKNTISLITLVHYNNFWGRVYFFPVKPFHKIIMRTLLKRYLRNN
jgi:Protein of unknown function (DUF2867).